MTAFLARLDGLLFKALTRDGLTDALIWVADQSVRLEDLVSKLEARWQARKDQRTPVPPVARAAGRHRLVGKARPFDRADYEWGQALKAWASRTEGQYLSWQ